MHSISIASHVGWRLDKFVHLIIESGSSKSKYNLQHTAIHYWLLKAFENYLCVCRRSTKDFHMCNMCIFLYFSHIFKFNYNLIIIFTFVLDTVISWVCSTTTDIRTLQNAKADASLSICVNKRQVNNLLWHYH